MWKLTFESIQLLQKAEAPFSGVFLYAQMGTAEQGAGNQTSCHSYKKLSHSVVQDLCRSSFIKVLTQDSI